ncbi:MAG: LysR family transcriptional regulator [Clostridia bacterium]|nr:LysR family transcriptional regulator [Clostridia bacterium]
MTLRHLQIFLAVADASNMTRASEKLFIAQPTVSQAIAELEKHYGVKLFDRLSRRLYLTGAGKVMLGYARHVINLIGEMDQAIEVETATGCLRIGATLTIGTCLLPSYLAAFGQRHPQASVAASIRNTRDIEQLVIRNELDLALVEGSISNPEIMVQPYMVDRLVLVCGTNHPLYNIAGPIPLQALEDQSFIVREQGSGTRELFEHTMALQQVPWKIAWEAINSDAMVQAALNGLGIAVLSGRLIETPLRSGQLRTIQVQDLDLVRSFCLAYHKNKYLTPTMQALIALILQPVI